jgi:hypothetical protein
MSRRAGDEQFRFAKKDPYASSYWLIPSIVDYLQVACDFKAPTIEHHEFADKHATYIRRYKTLNRGLPSQLCSRWHSSAKELLNSLHPLVEFMRTEPSELENHDDNTAIRHIAGRATGHTEHLPRSHWNTPTHRVVTFANSLPDMACRNILGIFTRCLSHQALPERNV